MFGAFGGAFFFFLRKMKNAPKKWVCAVSRRNRRGQITFPHLIIPRHRNGAGVNSPFPPQPVFAESRPILGLLTNFGNNYSQTLEATKEDWHLRGGGSVNRGVSLFKNIFCGDHRGLLQNTHRRGGSKSNL